MNKSPWLDFDRPTFPTLSQNLEADVVIVGGGIAGVLTLYYLLKNTNKKVILLEKNHIASGATGHNAGFVVNTTEKVTQELIEQFGLEKTQEGLKELDAGWDLLKDVLETVGCQDQFTFLEGGRFGYTSARWLLRAAEEEFSDEKIGRGAWRYMLSDKVIKDSEIPEHLKSYISIVSPKKILEALKINDSGYVGAAIPYNPRIFKGRMNSAALCYRIIHHLKQKYSDRFEVFENSFVQTIQLESSPVRVRCQNGMIVCKDVILCTNGYTNFKLKNGDSEIFQLKDSISGLVGYMVAYYDQNQNVWTSALFDDRNLYKNVQYFYYHRAPSFDYSKKMLTVVGGPERSLSKDEVYDAEETVSSEVLEIDREFLKKTFGEVRGSFDFVWQGLMGYTKNESRWVGRDLEYPHLLYNLGCNGIGLLSSIAGGNRISKIITGETLPPSCTDPQ